MKKRENELMRIETVINNDRLKLKDEFSKLLERDLTSLLQEYFYLDGAPIIGIEKSGKGFNVSITFFCSQIKNFINIPS